MDLKTINSDQLQIGEENSKVNENLVECKEAEEQTVFEEDKIPIVKRVLNKKLFCPPFMSRIDHNMPHFEYKTIWGCNICLKTLLSKTAAINHANICKLPITKEEDIPVEELHKVMMRKEIWIKHLNKHETPDYDINNWGDDLSNDEKM